MNFGGISLGGELGGYDIVNVPATSLPQELASAVATINTNILGATYDVIWYVGKQLVNGTNYLLVAKEIRITKDRPQLIVGLVVNIPPNDKGNKAKIVKIIEEASLSPELRSIFDLATQHLCGVGYKPVVYVGSQVVRGINHYFICQATGIYPGAVPYAVMLCVNVFEKQVSVVSIEPLE